MEPIPLIWCFGNRGDRCHGLLLHAFEGILWPKNLNFSHHLDHTDPALVGRGAVVVVSGGVQRDYVEEIAVALDKLSWALVIVAADEEGRFPWRRLLGPRRKVWLQMPAGDRHAGVDRKFLIGWPGDTREILSKAAPAPPVADRLFPWLFIGQMQHDQRRACVETLGRRMDGGLVSRTAGFNQGYPKEEYLESLTKAYLAPCPAGTHTTDCFRIYEALEAGCLPIVQRRCPGQESGYDYWQDLLGAQPPFPVVEDWREFNAIADKYRDPVLRLHDANLAMIWWMTYKRALTKNLANDVFSLADGGSGNPSTGISGPMKHSRDDFRRVQFGPEEFNVTIDVTDCAKIPSLDMEYEKVAKMHPEEFLRQLIWRCNWHPAWFGCLPVIS